LDIFTLVWVFIVLIIVIPILSASIKVIREYERAVHFRLGRLTGPRGPGLFFIIPFVDSIVKVDLRIMTTDVPRQEIITKDNVSVKVDAVIYYRVEDPVKAVVKISNFHYAIALLGQTVLRDVIGQVELDDLLTRREEINKRIQSIVDQVTGAWGVKVVMVTIKTVELPEGLVRAMAKQAEAERLRRARIIEAEAEKAAAKILAEAANIYEVHPIALRLRELQTYIDIAREKNMILITESTTSRISGETVAAALAAQKRLSETESK